METHEQRRHPRFKLAVEVDFRSSSNFYAGKTRDLSEGGLFIEAPVAMPIGTIIDLRMSFLSKVHEVPAEVAWVMFDDDGAAVGFGARFIDLRGSVRRAVQAFMALRSPMAFDVVEAVDDGGEAPAPSRADVTSSRRGPPPLPSV